MAVAEMPFDLVRTKLAEPVVRQGTVHKNDVIAGLLATPGRVVTIVAPAGYGKTTLLAGWADADPRPFAWVSLDERDEDPVTLLRYIAAAVHSVEPVEASVLDALTRPGDTAWATRVPWLAPGLFTSERPLVLALDDVHLLRNPASLDVLAALVEYVPPGSLVAIASRETTVLPVARWRAHGWMTEVGVPDLRLDDHEADALLRAAGLQLPAAAVVELTDRVEGWPAGLYLTALARQVGAVEPGGGHGLSSGDRFIADYFRLEWLCHLPDDDASFLRQTSMLDRMSGGLCDAVLDTADAASRLEALERANGFVVALDREREWYRYHHLFRTLLRQELERSEPELVATLNRRAMEWCLANDLDEEAVWYGHAAGELDQVAALVDRLALPLNFDGRLDTLDEWLAWFSDDELRHYPSLAVYAAWVRAMTGKPAEADRLLGLADGASSRIPLSDGSDSVAPWVCNLRAFMMPSGVERALADADRALELFHPASLWRSSAYVIRGTANALRGELERARADLDEAVGLAGASGAADDLFTAHGQLALLAASEGAWGRASRHAKAACDVVEAGGLGNYLFSAIVHVAAARVSLHEGREEDTREALARAHRLRPLLDHGFPWLAVTVGHELTRVHLALGETAVARGVFAESETVREHRPDLGTLSDDARQLRERLAAAAGPAGARAMSLTGAELRLLPYLATHLTFAEIGGRLHLSKSTVKTQAISIYRKLGASSRSETIERAIDVGLLESSIYPDATQRARET